MADEYPIPTWTGYGEDGRQPEPRNEAAEPCPCGCTDHACDHSGFYVCEQCPPGCHGTPQPGEETLIRDAINAHIKAEAERIGTYHGDPAGTPGGTGYCIPAAVATQIVDKYLTAEKERP